MAKTNLTEEEKNQIIEALNSGAEPSPELMPKLFPNLCEKTEKFDVATLDKAKIATLEYAGKRSEAAILNQIFLLDSGSPLQVERCFEGGSLTSQTQLTLFEKNQNNHNNWQNFIVQGDNLQFLKTCYQNTDPIIKDKVKGKVKLVYIDPPFATKSDFKGSVDEKSYSDKIDSAEFIEGLRERLIYIREIMADNGTIYAHCDWRMVGALRIIMEEVFRYFKNVISWKRSAIAAGVKTQWRNSQDFILFFSKSNKHTFHPQFGEYTESSKKHYSQKDERGIFQPVPILASGRSSGETGLVWRGINPNKLGKNGMHWLKNPKVLDELDAQGLIYWPAKEGGTPRLKYYKSEAKGVYVSDFWNDIDVINSMAIEYMDYPTQKPEALLKRIILASSDPGDLVLDVFAGSGTTAAVAEKLDRRWVVCDFGKHAIYTMQKRILRISESNSLGPDTSKNKKYEKPPKPFCVVSCGAYDFSRIMNLRENKDAYINFVLGLFQLPRDETGLNGKYKLANIYGEKEGNPVEVYPVWEDEYLKNVRIDEDYLNGIVTQSGGKLKGDYYIITPETCTVVSDTVLDNRSGDKIHFKLLKFPYKILEDVSRNFRIQEQPSSQDNVNNLINSTGFYFNNEVEIELEKIKSGLKITRFKTSILDTSGKRFNAIEGLAMLLIDIDYDDKIFDMENTIFSKDINENNEVKIAGLSNNIAVIAIDKHGNESKPFIIKE